MSKTKVTKTDKAKAEKMLKSISPIGGEKRAIYKCSDCGKLFVRRFIPYFLAAWLLFSAIFSFFFPFPVWIWGGAICAGVLIVALEQE